MNQLALDLTPPRARRRDPQTSHDAAEKARTFQARHIALIWDALKTHGPMTPREISRKTGLEYVAVQRRGAEMWIKNLIDRGPDVKDRQLVWRAR